MTTKPVLKMVIVCANCKKEKRVGFYDDQFFPEISVCQWIRNHGWEIIRHTPYCRKCSKAASKGLSKGWMKTLTTRVGGSLPDYSTSRRPL